MNWDLVIKGLLDELAAQPTLSAIFGEDIFLGGEQEHVVPSIQAHNLADTETELWAPVTVQFDFFHAELSKVITAENFVRVRYRAPLPIPIGNLTCFVQFEGGADLETPTRDRYFGRAIRFTFTPLKAAYTGG